MPENGALPDWIGPDGLRFSCTQCGNCCTGPPGYVWVTDEEADRIADRLGIDPASFRATHTRPIGDRMSLTERLTDFGHDCVFLDRETLPGRAICSIYEARPGQCRTWPFWPENLETNGAWAITKRVTPCPGMDQGRLHTPVEIRIAMGLQSSHEPGPEPDRPEPD